jgi:hypothetical protein
LNVLAKKNMESWLSCLPNKPQTGFALLGLISAVYFSEQLSFYQILRIDIGLKCEKMTITCPRQSMPVNN